jgi:hypothetical protein
MPVSQLEWGQVQFSPRRWRGLLTVRDFENVGAAVLPRAARGKRDFVVAQTNRSTGATSRAKA